MSTIVDILFYGIWIFVFVERHRKNKARKILGRNIRLIRKSQKISQNQLAFECGLSRQHISYIESGVKSPTVETLLSIADAMDIHVKTLLDFEY